jgi:hypothetical protein
MGQMMDIPQTGIWAPWLGRIADWLNKWLDRPCAIECTEHFHTALSYSRQEAQTVHYLVRVVQRPGYAVLSYDIDKTAGHETEPRDGTGKPDAGESRFGLHLARALGQTVSGREDLCLRRIHVPELNLLESANLPGTTFRGIARVGQTTMDLQVWLSDLLASASLPRETFETIKRTTENTAPPGEVHLMVARWKFPETLRHGRRAGDILLLPPRANLETDRIRGWLLVGEFLWPVSTSTAAAGHFTVEKSAPVFSNERICWNETMYACARFGPLSETKLRNVTSGNLRPDDTPETEFSLWSDGELWAWASWITFEGRLGIRLERLANEDTAGATPDSGP